jgi:hypothetical protein
MTPVPQITAMPMTSEREYRLDIERHAFFHALKNLGEGVPNGESWLTLTYQDGRLALTRHFAIRVVFDEISAYVPATGWWPHTVSVEWSDAEPYGDRERAFAEPFFIRFAEERLHLRDQPIAFGRSFGGQLAMDYTTSTSGGNEEPATEAPVALVPPLDALLARITEIDAENGGQAPMKGSEIAERYERDADLVRLLKAVRGGKCQICGHTFTMRNGGTYTEAHHLEELANGGLDVSRNMLIVCANHHRQFHYGDVQILQHDADTLTVRMDDEAHTIALGLAPARPR